MGNFLFNLLGRTEIEGVQKTTQEVARIVNIAVSVFYGVVLAILVFFAIYLGWRLAKAEDDSQRKQAKAQLFYSIVGIVGVGLLIVFIRVVIPQVTKGISDVRKIEDYNELKLGEIVGAVDDIIGVILQILLALVGVFACYVAWQFIKAEDDGKRKQAKQQLIYCFIAIVGVALLNLVATIVLRLVQSDQVKKAGQSFQWVLSYLPSLK